MTALYHISTGSSLVGVLAYAISRRGAAAKFGCAAIAAAAATLMGYLIDRWSHSGRAPLSNLHESLLVFAFFALAAGAVFSGLRRHHLLGGLGALFATLALGYASTLDPQAGPLVPALRSNWLLIHVTTCMAAYAGLALSFGAAATYLVRAHLLQTPAERLSGTEQAAARAVVFAFPLLTIGIVTGAVWANAAWGSYWGWDPKETWSLVTWLVYGVYLHARLMRGWQGKRAAWLLVLAFAAVAFTYFGVAYLMKGLHSYA